MPWSTTTKKWRGQCLFCEFDPGREARDVSCRILGLDLTQGKERKGEGKGGGRDNIVMMVDYRMNMKRNMHAYQLSAVLNINSV